MKVLSVSILMILTSLVASAQESTLLTCTYTGQNLGAPTYTLSVVTNEGGRDQFFLNKIPLNPTAEIMRVAVPGPIVYGNTWIVTLDQGRSGYAHLFASPKATVIDINLFQLRDTGINTNGSLTEYTCQ